MRHCVSPPPHQGASEVKVSVLASVGVSNSGGYSVYLGSNDTNLVGVKDRTSFIPGVSGVVSFDNLQDNGAGIYGSEKELVYQTVLLISQSLKDKVILFFTNNNSRIRNEEKDFCSRLCCKITNDMIFLLILMRAKLFFL